MNRFINFRAFLFIFIGAIVGVVFCFQSFISNLMLFILSATVIVGLLTFVILLHFFDKEKRFSFINKFIVCFLIGFILYSSISCVNFFSFNKTLEIENAQIFARVCSVSEKPESAYLILEDLEIINLETGEKHKINSKMSVNVSFDEYVKIKQGDKIRFKTTLNNNNLIEDEKFNSYYYKYNLKYSDFVSSLDVSVTNGSLKFDEKVRKGVKDILFENLSYDNASIAYAAIFGDKTLLDNDIYSSFSISGTAHLLCVSGLHVGFLVALLYLFLKLFKLKKKYIFIILLIILSIYCYLCGFSASVVRASIMSLVFCIASAMGSRYDSLSSLSFAGCLILMFKPFFVFDVGFQLSFASCFGIILLAPTFNRFFEKINFANKFSNAFSITLSASIATFPIILHNFEKLSFLSVCANIIVVPIFSIIFSLLIIFVLLNTIFPFGFLFCITELGLNFIITLTKSFGAVTSMIFVANSFTFICSVIFYSLMLFISKFINLKIKFRVLYIFMLATVFCFSYLFQYFPANFAENYLLNMSIENSTIITNSNNVKVMVGINKGTKNDLILIKKDLFDFKILNLDILILPQYNEEMQFAVTSICNDYNVKALYLPSLESNAEKYLFKNLSSTKIIKASEEYKYYDNFSFKILSKIQGVFLNVMENEQSFNMLICKNLNKTTSTYLIRENLSADYVKFNYLNKNYIESVKKFDKIYCESSSTRQSNVFKLNRVQKLVENI